jgi:hypothetical protein
MLTKAGLASIKGPYPEFRFGFSSEEVLRIGKYKTNIIHSSNMMFLISFWILRCADAIYAPLRGRIPLHAPRGTEISLTVTESDTPAIDLYLPEGYTVAHVFDVSVWQRERIA